VSKGQKFFFGAGCALAHTLKGAVIMITRKKMNYAGIKALAAAALRYRCIGFGFRYYLPVNGDPDLCQILFHFREETQALHFFSVLAASGFRRVSTRHFFKNGNFNYFVILALPKMFYTKFFRKKFYFRSLKVFCKNLDDVLKCGTNYNHPLKMAG